MARALPPILVTASKRDKGEFVMRSPSGPLFKAYEIIAIVLFLAAAAGFTGMNLVY